MFSSVTASSMFPVFSESVISRSVLNATTLGLGLLATLHITAPLWPENAQVKDGDAYDFIVVGAGAGAVVASRLAENTQTKVLIVEAGGDPSVETLLAGLFTQTQNSYQDWAFKSEKEPAAVSQDGGNFNLAAGKVLGGSTSIGHLLYMRTSPQYFNDWAALVNDDTWNYENVLPYFKKSENLKDESILKSNYSRFHGKEGRLSITKESRETAKRYFEAFKEVGKPVVLDVTGEDTVGYTHGLLYNDVIRQSTALFLSSKRNAKNLDVLKNSLVIEILFDEDNTAIGVAIQLANGNIIKVYARKEVIVSAGVYNTPKLLMLSGIGPREHLESFNITVRSDLPVGETLEDHVASLLTMKMEKSVALTDTPKVTQLGLPLIVGNVDFDSGNNNPQYQTTNLILPNDQPNGLIICTQLFGYKSKFCDPVQKASLGRNTLFTLLALLNPFSSGRVELQSTDPNVAPLIKTGFFEDERDVVNLARYVEDFLEVQTSTYFKEVGAELVDFEIEECSDLEYGCAEYWQCHVKNTGCSLYHQTSSCPMGKVVDSKLCVMGTKRLRIVDASIFPSVTRGNPQANTIMVAEKAADMIKADYDL